MKHDPRRAPRWPLLASLVLHLAAVAWLWRAEAPPAGRPEQRERPLQWLEVVERTEASGAPEVRAGGRADRVRPKRSAKVEVSAPELGGEADALVADAPELELELEGEGPALRPRLPGVEREKGIERGRTLRPGDSSLGESREAEGARVAGRVQGLIQDELARARVESGAVDSYFGRLRKALEHQLRDAPLFSATGRPSLGNNLVNAWRAGAQSFGATGSLAPGGNPVMDSARTGGAASQLVAVIEFRQDALGKLKVTLLETSGNEAYDRFVLERAPGAVAALSAPSPSASGAAVTVWEVAGHVSYTRKVKLKDAKPTDALWAAGSLLIGAPFEETTGEVEVLDWTRPHFDIRARLLRAHR